MAFLLIDRGKPFAAFGHKFARWCKDAGRQPVTCEDGQVRSYRAHGLCKAALMAAANAGYSLHKLMALSGHSSPLQLQKYLEEEVEQESMVDNAITKVLAHEIKTATGGD